jgi:hypothetical protein
VALLLAALRRLLLLVVLATAVTVLGSVALGTLAGSSVQRSISLGFYAVGSFLMVAGFFVGNRGPTRVKSESPGAAFVPFPMFGQRRLRWATAEEREEAINMSALFVALGFVLILLGIAADGRNELF